MRSNDLAIIIKTKKSKELRWPGHARIHGNSSEEIGTAYEPSTGHNFHILGSLSHIINKSENMMEVIVDLDG
jgi:hypothetical protein